MAKKSNRKKEKSFLNKVLWRLFGAFIITLTLAAFASLVGYDAADASANVATSRQIHNYLGSLPTLSLPIGEFRWPSSLSRRYHGGTIVCVCASFCILTPAYSPFSSVQFSLPFFSACCLPNISGNTASAAVSAACLPRSA